MFIFVLIFRLLWCNFFCVQMFGTKSIVGSSHIPKPWILSHLETSLWHFNKQYCRFLAWSASSHFKAAVGVEEIKSTSKCQEADSLCFRKEWKPKIYLSLVKKTRKVACQRLEAGNLSTQRTRLCSPAQVTPNSCAKWQNSTEKLSWNERV